jgi:hypothetical protein
VIERALAGIPGELHHHEWRDFGHNRSELMRVARGTADYLLLLDADQTLSELGTLPPLTVDAYRLRHAGSMEYDVSRLVRGDLPWRFEGRTHEYLACDVPTTQQTLHTWQVVHHGDGGSRATKFERDQALLELTLAERPTRAPCSTWRRRWSARRPRPARVVRAALDDGWLREAWYADKPVLLGRRPVRRRAVAGVLATPPGASSLHGSRAANARAGGRSPAVAPPTGDRAPRRHLVRAALAARRGREADHERACTAGPNRWAARHRSGSSPTPSTLESLVQRAVRRVSLQPTPPWPQFSGIAPTVTAGR